MTPPIPAATGSGLLVAGSGGSANDIGPGLLGFLVVAAIGLVLFFLLRSMSKHLRRVRSVRDAGLEPGSTIESGNGTAAAGRRAAAGGALAAGGGSLAAGSAGRPTAGGGARAADTGDDDIGDDDIGNAGGDSGRTSGA